MKKGAITLKGRRITCSVGNFNHRKCASDFAKHRIPNQNVTEIGQTSSSVPGLRSNNPVFDFSTNYCLCARVVSLGKLGKLSATASRKFLKILPRVDLMSGVRYLLNTVILISYGSIRKLYNQISHFNKGDNCGILSLH